MSVVRSAKLLTVKFGRLRADKGSYPTGETPMKKTAILIDFAKELEGTNDRIFDEIFAALRERGIEPTITFKEYDDEHGGPVIYFP
jgi:hypothetical protein